MGKNVFSFEFCSRLDDGSIGRSMGEYFLLVGLLQWREQFRYMLSADVSFGGYSITDFGNAFNALSLSGEFHIYMSGNPPGSGGGLSLDSVTSTAMDFAAEVLPFLGRDGAMEFHDFIGLLYCGRSGHYLPTMDSQAQRIYYGGMLTKDRFSQYAIIFHDYGRNRHVEVAPAPEGITVTRSVEDTNTYRWEMQLTVLQEYEGTGLFTESPIRRLLSVSPFYAISRVMGVLKSAIYLPLTLSGAALQVTRLFQTTIASAKDLVNDWKNMQSLWRSDGRMISQGWSAIRAETIGDKPSLAERLERTGNSIQSAATRARAAMRDYQEHVATGIQAFETLLSNLTQIVAPTTSEADLPDTDFAPIIEHPAFPLLTEAIWAEYQALGESIRAEIDNQFRVIPVTAGDSWISLAERYTGNPEDAPALARYNGKAITAGPVGVVRIPYEYPSFIYAKVADPVTPESMERSILGEDLSLTEDRDFDVSPDGDLAIVSGAACLENNLIDLLDTPRGALPAHPGFGNPLVPGELHEVWLQDAWMEKLLMSIRSDPRVSSCVLKAVRVDGNSRWHTIHIESIHGAIAWDMNV